ncbi:plasma membrane ammonium transmembrane transporter Amf1 [Schizosaccharomyces osmophilus]|uniref:Plasma membrane ammonium transmembrane transporter Amf1 n=1 Tax=Schizosaccharomyces osmophilus TaxID=2545709 RepID=A0AAE9WAM8_9SCHI|nr:plasma membrane ammonium transmembrane transporter Amf1 [Schizosaccharomyces osmophilus]WBW72385.1 plasma membrane ammonium transmembrane transporter Amf1 [Schizosaccharomyces osmophilus]
MNSPSAEVPSLKAGGKPPVSNPPMSLVHELLFVFMTASAQLMTQAGLGQTIAPSHIIGKAFGTTNGGQLSWFPASYSLTVGTFILIAGRLGDMYGHKNMFMFGYAWYSLWSLISGFSVYAKSAIMYDVCRALTGIAPAFLLPNALAILGRVYPPGKRKQWAFCMFGATAPNGFLLGAVFSGIFAQLAWWPWAYWCTCIVCFFFCLASYFIIPDIQEDTNQEKASEKQHFDYLGSFFGIAGLVLINFAWNQGPVVGWQIPYVYVLLIVGFLSLLVFLYVEHKTIQPLLPPDALNGEIGFILVCIAAGWACFGIWIYYLWNFFEVMRNSTPLLTVAQMAPVGISGCVAAATTGKLMSRFRPIVCMIISMVAFTVGSILLATAPIHQTYWAQTFVATIVTPWGMDMSFPAATLVISDFVSKENQGIAASLVSTVVNYSISIGLGIAGTIEVHLNHKGTNILRGYRSAWYMGIGFGGLGVGVSLIAAVFIFTKASRRGPDVENLGVTNDDKKSDFSV